MDDKLSIYSQFGDPIQAMQHIGKVIATSGMFGVKSEAQGQVLALMCMSERKSPLAVIREFHITRDGRIIKRAERMHADFQRSGGRIQWVHSDDKRCEAIFFHEVHAPSGITCSCTIEHAAKAGVTGKDAWQNFPRRMLQCWVIREGIKQVLPDITSGFITEDLAESSGFEGGSDYQPAFKELPAHQETSKQTKQTELKSKKTTLPDRAKKVVNVFHKWGVLLEDIEKTLSSECCDWTDDHYAMLTQFKNDIVNAGGEAKVWDLEIEKAREIFDLPPGSLF